MKRIKNYVNIFSMLEKNEEEIKAEEEKQKELDAKIREWEKKIKEKQKDMGGSNMSTQHTTQTSKTQRVLENRLDQVNCFNF